MPDSKNTVDYVFVFLEIFAREGGIQSYVKDILRAYLELFDSAEGKSAEIFLLRDSSKCENPFSSDRLQFHYLKTLPPWLGRIKLALALWTGLLFRRPQHVFCGHINLAPLIQVFCQCLGIPYTVLTYGKEVWESLPPKQLQALQQADSIWTIGRYSRDRVCQSNEIPAEKVRLLPCVVDGTIFDRDRKPPHLLEKYDLENAKVLMTVARLWSGDIYKGVDVTIRALPEIARVFPDVKYLVIGRGDDLPRLQKLAADLGVGDRVIFAGFIATEDLPAHYRVADAYIMPSQEGFGIVYLEAMASGIPVLSGDADGSVDPLQDGKLGWRVPHRDVEAVARACIEILNGLSDRTDPRCNGEWLRECTLAKFGKETLRQKLKQLLEEAEKVTT
ncbi:MULTISPECIES: glycosyltransferase family 4 protein [Spirulina sp. CCY15215]|uniref:glycosyltransferase family 4 protein n=1 Tax=Spirulina sp. CCY15215 TaxID=2767591 RepID=UPI001EF369B2|nr:glycosyltransferase family 4 protein [Spirulina major]